MKILVAAQNLDDTTMAVSKRILSFAASLTAEHTVAILGSNHILSDDIDLMPIKPVFRNEKKSKFILRALDELILGSTFFLKVLANRGVDITLISSPPFLQALLVAFAVRLKRQRYVIDVRDRYPQALFELTRVSRSGIIGRVLCRAERWLIKNATTVVCVTEKMAQTIRAENSGKAVIVIRNGSDLVCTRGPTSPRSVKLISAPKLLMYGNFGRYFCAETLSKFCDELREQLSEEFSLKLIGSGAGMEPSQWATHPEISLHGSVEREELIQIAADCHLAISVHRDTPNMRQGFPVKIYEYLSLGIPTVVIPRSEAGEIVERAQAGFTCSNDEVKLAAKYAADLFRDTELHQRIAENAYRAGAEMNRSKFSKEILRVVTSSL